MFISLEGIDGCGKTTQSKLLTKYFKEKGKNVILVREPGGTEFSESIRNILLNSTFNLNSISELLLFNAARADLTEKIIKPALAQGTFVITDRFFDSTTAYQGYGRKIQLEDVMKSNLLAAQGLEPDITFYLRVSLETSKERSKKKLPDRMESSGNDFFKRVYQGFEEISKNDNKRIVTIDANGTIEQTYNCIIKSLDERFKM